MVTGFRGSPLAEPFRSPAAGAKPSNSDMPAWQEGARLLLLWCGLVANCRVRPLHPPARWPEAGGRDTPRPKAAWSSGSIRLSF